MKLPKKISKPLHANARRLTAEWRFRHGGKPVLRRRTAAAMKALGGGIGYGALVEPAFLEMTQIEITIPGLDPRLDGYRIAHLSDVHYNVAAGKSFIQRVVQKTNALDPDLVALTGDFITHNAGNLDKCMAVLSDLRAPDGSFIVRGNHDYRATLHDMRNACRENGFRLLENEHVVIRPARHRIGTSPNGTLAAPPAITIAGVGDMWEGECRPGIALEGANPDRPAVLLSHHGDVAELLTDEHRVDLILSGHTHGGQVRLRGRNVPIISGHASKYTCGLVTTPHTRVYISRGVGTSALRFRWNCRPEIALINLHSGEKEELRISDKAP